MVLQTTVIPWHVGKLVIKWHPSNLGRICILVPRDFHKSSLDFRGHLITNFPTCHGITYNKLLNVQQNQIDASKIIFSDEYNLSNNTIYSHSLLLFAIIYWNLLMDKFPCTPLPHFFFNSCPCEKKYMWTFLQIHMSFIIMIWIIYYLVLTWWNCNWWFHSSVNWNRKGMSKTKLNIAIHS